MAEFSNKELDVHALPKLEEQSFEKLHPNYLTVIVIFRVIVSAVVLSAVLIAGFQGMEYAFVIVSGALLISVLFVITGYLGFYKKGFALREQDVSYRRGLIFHSVTVVPLNRIQHSELVRGPFARLFGLSSVKIYTAGGSTSDVTIPGMDLAVAEKVRDFITSKIKDQEDVSE